MYKIMPLQHPPVSGLIHASNKFMLHKSKGKDELVVGTKLLYISNSSVHAFWKEHISTLESKLECTTLTMGSVFSHIFSLVIL